MGLSAGTKASDFHDFYFRTIVTSIRDKSASIITDVGCVPPEVAMSEPIIGTIKEFIYWSDLKLDSPDAIGLTLECANHLVSIGEREAATLMYNQCITKVDEVNDGGSNPNDSTSPTPLSRSLSPFDITHKTQSIYGISSNQIHNLLALDPLVKYPNTLKHLLESLHYIQSAMSLVLNMPDKQQKEDLAYLILNGTNLLFTTCDPLYNLGFSRQVIEFVTFSALSMEALTITAATRHLPWRMRIYAVICHCYEDMNELPEAVKALERAISSTQQLRQEEERDPPLPLAVTTILNTAETDALLLQFKYKLTLSPPTSPDDTTTIPDLLAPIPTHLHPRAIIEAITNFNDRHLYDRPKSPDAPPHLAPLLAYAANIITDTQPPPPASTPASPRSPRDEGADAPTPPAPLPSPSDVFFQDIPITLTTALAKELYRTKSVDAFNITLSNGLKFFQQKSDHDVEVDFAKNNGLPPPSDGSQVTNLKGVVTNATNFEEADAETLLLLKTELELLQALKDLATWSPAAPAIEEEPPADAAAAAADESIPLSTVQLAAPAPAPYTLLEMPDMTFPLELYLALTATLDRCARQNSTGPILRQRADFLVDAAMALYAPYTTQILKYTDISTAPHDVSPPILSALTISLQTILALFSSLSHDDTLLRSTLSLRLSLLLADFTQDPHRAVSTLRSAINYLSLSRSENVNPEIHQPKYREDTSAMQRAAITTDVDDFTAMLGKSRLGASAYAGQGVFGAASQLESNSQALAATHTDLYSTLYRVELSLGRDVTDSHGVHISKLQARRQKEKLAASKVAAQQAKKKPQKSTAASANPASTAATLITQQAPSSTPEELHYCQYTESVLLSECKKNSYQRALLQIEMASSRQHNPAEMEALLLDTMNLLKEAKQKEDLLLLSIAEMESDDFNTPQYYHAPPKPLLISRSLNSITVTIHPFKLAGKGHNPTALAAIHHVKLFGKPAGAGTDVSTNNTAFPGTGVSVPYDAATNSVPPITVTGLPANDNYVFAVVAFTEKDEMIGEMGEMCPPIDALNPLPTTIIWSYLAQRALFLDCPKIAEECSYAVLDVCVSRSSEAFHSNLNRGWEAKPTHGLTLRPSIVDRLSDSLQQAFCKSACVYVDSRAPPDNTMGGQISTLKTLKIMLMAAVVAAIADDGELLKEIVWRAYHIMLPILSLEQSSDYVVQALLFLQQTLLIIPKANFDEAMHSVFACLSYQITKAGLDIAEIDAIKFALFDSNTTSPSDSAFMTMQQRALFDVWQSMGSFSSVAEEDLVKAVNIPPLPPPQVPDDVEDAPPAAEEEVALPRLSAVLVNREIGSTLSNPSEAMELLKEKFADDPAYYRFFCMVCHSAIMSNEMDLARSFLVEFEFKSKDLTAFMKRVLAEDSEDFTEYIKEGPEDPDAASDEEKKDEAMPDDEEPTPVADDFPTEEDKRKLMILSDVEVLKALCDFSDSLSFGAEYLAENQLNVPINIAKARGLTAVICSLVPSHSDGVASDLSLEIEDVDMNEDPDLVEEPLVDETVPSRGELLAKFEEEKAEKEAAGGNERSDEEEPFTFDNKTAAVQSVMSGFYRLSCAAWRARCARSWTKLVVDCQHMWNVVNATSLPPHLFSRDVVVDGSIRFSSSPFLFTATYLLDMLEILSVVDLGPQDDESVIGDVNVDAVMQKLASTNPDQLIEDSNGIDKSTIDVDWVCQFVVFTLKALCCGREWQQLVDLGRRLNRLTGNRVAGESFPLAIFGQKRLNTRAERKLASRQGDRDVFVSEFEAEQAKKPKRRYRVAAKVEKTDEERAFDKGRIKLENKVGDAKGSLKINEQRLADILDEELVYTKAKSSALSSLHEARHKMMKFIHLIEDPTVNLDSSIKSILNSYSRTTALLRDRRETAPLVEALGDVGDFHLTLKNEIDANKAWSDGVDALFNTLDAASHWREILKTISGGRGDVGGFNGASIVEELGVFGCLGGGVILGKLCKFCCAEDQEKRMEQALLASELFRAPFSLSLPHPQRLCDFASYCPSQFCNGVNLFSDERRLEAGAMIASLIEVAEVLIEGEYWEMVLPVLCLGEYLCRWILMDVDRLVRVRLMKVKACAGGGFMSESMSLLAKVLKGKDLPTVAGGYAGGGGEGEGEGGGEEARDGLPFFGLAPFCNDKDIDGEENAGAVAWLCGRGWEEEEKVEGEEEVGFGGGMGGSHIGRSLLRLYGEEVVDMLLLVRVKVILEMAGHEKLDVVEVGGGRAVCDVYSGMRNDARSMISELQGKVMGRIALSAIFAEKKAASDERREERMEEKRKVKEEEKRKVEEEGGEWEEGEEEEEEEREEDAFLKERLATEGDVRNGALCLIFLACISFSERQFREARKYSSTGLALMVRCSEGGMTLEETKFVGAGNNSVLKKVAGPQMWLECKYLLSECALSQGRLEDVQEIVRGGVAEADEVLEKIWSRKLKLVGAMSLLLMGLLEESEGEARLLVKEYMDAEDKGFGFVRSLVFLSGLLQQKALGEGGRAAGDCWGESRALLEDAEGRLIRLGKAGGWIGNVRLTYDDIRSNEMTADMKPPLSTALGEAEFGAEWTATVDVAEEVVKSPLGNLYLKSVKWLSEVRVLVAEVLGYSVPKMIAIDLNSLGEDFEMVIEEGRDELRKKGKRKVELGISTMRSVSRVNGAVRGNGLLMLGLFRMWKVEDWGSGGDAGASIGGQTMEGRVEGAEEEFDGAVGFKESSDALLGSLAVQWGLAGFDREKMQMGCMHLVNLYGGKAGALWGGDGSLKVAIWFLLRAAEMAKIQKRLFFDVNGLFGGVDVAGLVDGLPKGLVKELGGAGGFDCVDLMHHYLALMRERGLSGFGGHSVEEDLARVHCLLYDKVDVYRDQLCCGIEAVSMPKEGEEGEMEVSVKGSLVCAQWYSVDLEDDVVDDRCVDLHPWVQLMMVVGCGDAGGGEAAGKGAKGGKGDKGEEVDEGAADVGAKMRARFGEDLGPLLISKGEVVLKAREVRAMQERVAGVRLRMEDYYSAKKSEEGAEGAVEGVLGLQEAWEGVIRELVRLMGGGERQKLVDRDGDELVVPLNNLQLGVVESFFDLDCGVNLQSVEIAYLLRDCFEGRMEGGGGVDEN